MRTRTRARLRQLLALAFIVRYEDAGGVVVGGIVAPAFGLSNVEAICCSIAATIGLSIQDDEVADVGVGGKTIGCGGALG